MVSSSASVMTSESTPVVGSQLTGELQKAATTQRATSLHKASHDVSFAEAQVGPAGSAIGFCASIVKRRDVAHLRRIR